MMTYEQIKELIHLVSEHHLHALEIERSGFRLKITGTAPPASPTVQTYLTAPAPPSSAAAVDGGATLAASAGEAFREAAPPPTEARVAALKSSSPALHLIASPIVGTFYGSSSPTADPFVRVGDRVRKGQVLCIIEAMKLMNEIESDIDGTIAEIHPRNAQPVEFGEPLFGIRLD
ncbi:MAG: acetyl-CoA carboxylase biotin carboxyl carrier protein [Thermoanaerobaculia bacterium]